jgi:hypothetical protein
MDFRDYQKQQGRRFVMQKGRDWVKRQSGTFFGPPRDSARCEKFCPVHIGVDAH